MDGQLKYTAPRFDSEQTGEADDKNSRPTDNKQTSRQENSISYEEILLRRRQNIIACSESTMLATTCKSEKRDEKIKMAGFNNKE